MTLERANALAALRICTAHTGSSVELPHPDGLIQRPRNKMVTVRAKSDRVDAVAVTIVSISPLHERGVLRVPDADALVQAAGSHVAVIGRDSHGGDTIFYLEREDALVLLNIPQADCAVARAGGDVATVGSKV